MINSDEVKIQAKTSDAYKELESKNTQFYKYKPKQERCFKVFFKICTTLWTYPTSKLS